MQAGEALHNYVVGKVEHLGRYFEDGIISVDVVLDSEKNREICELVAHLVRKKIVKASAEADDMHTAVDAAVEKMKKQLRRYKARVREKGKEKPSQRPATAGPAARTNSRRDDILHAQVFVMKPMTAEEAVLQLEGYEKRDFLIFMDVERGALSVIHRLPDGRYEVLEPIY